MKKIPLTQGQFALVDDEDFDTVNKYSWAARAIGHSFTAMRRNGQTTISMHRQILGLLKSYDQVDHIDGNPLNNTRSNLRVCALTENLWKRGCNYNNACGLKGVRYSKRRKKWYAQIQANKKRMHIGSFNSKEEAANAYNEAALCLHGEFAFLNQV